MKEIIVYRHHLHQCPGFTTPSIQKHLPHVWRCFRPNCTADPVYLCGLMADTVARRLEQARKNMETGRETMRRDRENALRRS